MSSAALASLAAAGRLRLADATPAWPALASGDGLASGWLLRLAAPQPDHA